MRAGRTTLLAAALVLAGPAARADQMADTWRIPPPAPAGLVGLLVHPPSIGADLAIQYRDQYLSPDSFFADDPVADRLGRERLAALKEQVAYEQAREVADLALERVLAASPLFVEIDRFRERRRLAEFFGVPVEPEADDPAAAAPAPPPVPRKALDRTLPGGVSVRFGAKIGVIRFEPGVQAFRDPIRARVSYSVTRNRLESTLGLRVFGPVALDLVHTWFTDDGVQAFRFTVSVPF